MPPQHKVLKIRRLPIFYCHAGNHDFTQSKNFTKTKKILYKNRVCATLKARFTFNFYRDIDMKNTLLKTLLLTTILATNAFADSGTCGDGCSWSFDASTGALTIQGSGSTMMDSYVSATNAAAGKGVQAPWISNMADIKSVNISGVSNIGANAFDGATQLKSASIPEGVTSIGTRAFNAAGIESISLPSTLTTMGNAVFQNAASLKSAEIPDSVTSFGQGMFYKASSLESVKLPSGLTEIPMATFQGNSSLTDVNIPSSVTSIGEGAFYSSGLQNITIPSSVEAIGPHAFGLNHSLENITFATDENGQSHLTTIGNSAFQSTPLITVFELPDSVKSVGQFAFGQPYTSYATNSLDTIVLNEGLEEIGSTAFSRANATSIILPASLFEGDRELNPYLLDYSNITTIYCPEGNQKCLSYVAMTCKANADITSEECINTTRPLDKQPTFATYKKEANGTYVINGNRYFSFSDMAQNKNAHMLKRIYTVEEANAVSGRKNTFKIRYK